MPSRFSLFAGETRCREIGFSTSSRPWPGLYTTRGPGREESARGTGTGTLLLKTVAAIAHARLQASARFRLEHVGLALGLGRVRAMGEPQARAGVPSQPPASNVICHRLPKNANALYVRARAAS